jgi:YrbI family 3-deoxy-D-manno-octulosonate 8-phosphate phosphatase
MVAQSQTVLGIVPARGGSKSIPGKNIKPLGGVPLLAYSIAAGLQSKRVHRVVVSTDDPEIASVAQKWGAEVPFTRPPELAEDDVPDLPVFLHTLQWLEEHEQYRPDVVVQLRPTSPFRPTRSVDEAVEALLENPNADSVRCVTFSGQNPFKMWRIEDGQLWPLLKTSLNEPYNMPRQKLPTTYWQTGHIDVIRTATILQKHSMTGDCILSHVIDPQYAVDLDTQVQWRFAEHLLHEIVDGIVLPEQKYGPELKGVGLVVLDFDGVFTDNRVFVSQDETEMVACSRGDGLGLGMLRKAGVPAVVLSTEVNPVVAARCKKLDLPYHQGVADKAEVFDRLAIEYGVDRESVIYVGNDVNDLPAMAKAGISVAVADAEPEVLRIADIVLTRKGGRGAIRELCDRIIAARS